MWNYDLFEEHLEWISELEHKEILHEVMWQPNWRFGQVSDEDIKPNYPMWVQNFYDIRVWDFKPDTQNVIKRLSERFMDMVPDDYLLVRCMASANTFGQDGDFHTDWKHPHVSITGVLYTDREWQTNWGGSTQFKKDNVYGASEYVPRKLITFDSSILHIGSGPQRRCKEMRTILAFQAVQSDALKERLNTKLDSSK